MKIKTSELIGANLDWAVAQVDPMCNGLTFESVPGGKIGFGIIGGEKTPCAFLSHGSCLSERMRLKRDGVIGYSPSTDWSQGGPLIDSFKLSVYASKEPETGETHHWVSVDELADERRGVVGPTPLIAACRALVFKRHGSCVDIPDDLVAA
ncbi:MULTISPECIES: phage protein NinX family protein [unclassified Marinobacter]|uniref:phage protein NinX family protein n=1 Tax=unclassified Marinobacter TaxID=83889 RepID=UPI001926E3FE|nr:MULTISPECIES: phage protein NinX family protein [unclassified Marinobacter]MBL3825108.1 DUF2591 family protein [Marinobacter sp. MC3]MBL3893688.1 DUF2591 family protein [Marinobacter sp. MW3]